MDRDHFWLDEGQFARLTPHLPTDTRGKPRADDRRVISGIVHVLKSGCRWADAPEVYGPRKTLYNRFVRWAAKGVWLNIFHALAASGDKCHSLSAAYREPLVLSPARQLSATLDGLQHLSQVPA